MLFAAIQTALEVQGHLLPSWLQLHPALDHWMVVAIWPSTLIIPQVVVTCGGITPQRISKAKLFGVVVSISLKYVTINQIIPV
jgi:hypothetical protein